MSYHDPTFVLGLQRGREFEFLVVLLSLMFVSAAFLYSWLRERTPSPTSSGKVSDYGVWLLWVLALLGFAIVAAFLWSSLPLHT